jgi:hypothetical protein
MGPAINSEFRDAEVAFTANSRTVYYNCTNRISGNGNDICVSYFVDGEWTKGEVVGPPISTRYSEVEPYISLDGNRLQFQAIGCGKPRRGGYMGIGEGGWRQEPVNSAPINSPYADHCLYFSGPDENTGYLTSMRPGGFGGNDIYSVHRVNGVWQEPVNLGPNVNTPYSDHHGMTSPDGRSIYFNSDRTGGLGGEDIYISTMDAKGVFGPAVNVTPLNSDKNDRCVMFTTDHRVVIFDSERDGGYGSLDLWWIFYENIKHIK